MASISSKRKLSDDATKPACKYGSNCYRKNLQHFQEFSHPSDITPVPAKRHKVEMLAKCYTGKVPATDRRLYFTTVNGIDDVYNDKSIAVGIEDLLLENCDNFIESVQFNYMFDLPWLIERYPESCRTKPLLLVHGHDRNKKEKTDLEATVIRYPNIDLVNAKLPIPFGTHHSKMMLLLYSNGFKVVIHTANLIHQDWFQKTQGVWVSPLFFTPLDNYVKEEDIFKADLIEYLLAYQSMKLNDFIKKIEDYDMTSANVHLIASVPGRHTGRKINKWGHLKLREVLKNNGPSESLVSHKWPVIGQFSSIGSLGENSSKWLCSEWLKSLSTCRNGESLGQHLKLIFPTMENVRNSLEGYSAGGSLPYQVLTAMKQRYLKEHLHQWKADNIGRSLASPHIKTYTRISPDNQSAAWFLLSSANLSKAAWGAYEKNQSQLMIRSYEIGVLIMPKDEKTEEKTCFAIGAVETDTSKEYLQLPYDVPLSPYDTTDKPWVWDIRYTKEDSHGKLWVPN